ncbi:MAG: hypothetical protein GX458_14705 [Phyllobacteriaceae bacterium]|nr:hypothetical protein [Phyllobacteriaceae bacterium]
MLRAVLASLYLLVGIGIGVPSARPATHVASTTAASAVAAIDCADHAFGAMASHHATKAPCAPAGKIADHRDCPNCPVGGSCFGVPIGTTVTASVLASVRSVDQPPLRATTDPTGRNPLPDPRPPRAVV